MSSQQQDQQITFKYLFIITPLEIKSNSKIKSTNPKAILIKLGNKTAKCTQMNTPLQLEIDVLYSKTLQKYCPIKGIIKIYDISEDGSEIISCVGGFQTDELLNQGKSNVVIEKELGTSKLKMDINIINKSGKKVEEKMGGAVRPSLIKESSSSRQKYLTSKKSPTDKLSVPLPTSNSTKSLIPSSSSQAPQTPTESRRNSLLSSEGYPMKNVDIPFKNTSSNINKSLEKINQALSFKRFQQNPISTKANQVLSKAEMQNLKQQLSDQRRKTAVNQDKLNKANAKIGSYRSALVTFSNQAKTYVDIFKKLLSELEIKDSKVQPQITQATKTLSLRYKDKNIEKTLQEFITLASKRVKEFIPFNDADLTTLDKDRNLQQFQQYKKQVSILKKLTMQKDKKIYSLQKQLEGVQTTIHNLKETNKHLNEENSYLREKNDQIQMNLYHKEVNLETLRKDLEKYSYENQEMDNKLYNMGLQIEELKEEVDNCNETIEQYREKYGDLKNVKNRAIEMEIKECIRWIDQQNRDLEMSEMEQTMQSQHNHEKDDSLSSVIRNIQLEKVPVEEMSIIRDELVRILKKIDNLMIK